VTTLVTGATGFIGSAVVRHLIAAGHDVRALVRPTSDRRNLEGVSCQIVIGDLAEPDSLVAVVAGCDAVFHLAADYRLWVPDPEAMRRVNEDGTRDLLRAAADAGASRIVYTSSVATLGHSDDGSPANEDMASWLNDMVGPYKRSKFIAEEVVRWLAEDEGVPVVIVNPSTPIGPRDIKPTPTGRIIVDAAAGRIPAYVDTGLNLVHVDDVAAGHLLAFERGEVGERYILGGDDMALRDILAEVARIVGRRPPKLRLVPGFVLPVAYIAEAVARLTGGEPRVTVDGVRMSRELMYFSSDKAKSALGYAPRPGIEALGEAVAWFRDNGYLS
jgi:dihydroflavonol-4-reductase